jgi:translation initiation factor 2 subunit 1
MVNEQQFNFRFYENEFPEVDDYVVVKIKKVDEYGFVSLLEYNYIEGLIQARDVSRYRIKSLKGVLPIGKVEVMQVLRVDKNKGKLLKNNDQRISKIPT